MRLSNGCRLCGLVLDSNSHAASILKCQILHPSAINSTQYARIIISSKPNSENMQNTCTKSQLSTNLTSNSNVNEKGKVHHFFDLYIFVILNTLDIPSSKHLEIT